MLALCLALLVLGAGATLLTGAEELSVVLEESFDDYEADVNANATKLSEFFNVDANGIGDGYVKIIENRETGNLFLESHVFTQVTAKTPIKGAYEFSLTTYEMQGGHRAGVFFRAPACDCAYYEADAGDPDNDTSTGRSGIWVYVYSDCVCVNVKAYDSSKSAKVVNMYHNFPLPEGSSYSKGIELRIIDTGTDAQIIVDDALICSLVFSEESGRNWRQNGIASSVKLLESVSMLNPDGTEVLTAEKTFVSAGESTIGWATRVANMSVDNVRVLTEAEEETTAAAETESETASETAALVTETETESASVVTEGNTTVQDSGQSDTADGNADVNTDTDTDTDTDAGVVTGTVDDSLTIWILIAVMLVAVGVTAGIITVKKRQQEKE